MNAAFAALWDTTDPKITAAVESRLPGQERKVVCVATRAANGSGIKYQVPGGEWHDREMVDTPKQLARRPIAVAFANARIYWQNLVVIDLSSTPSPSAMGSWDLLDVSYQQWRSQASEAYLAQLRTLPLDVLRAHLARIEGKARILKTLQRAIDRIVAQAETSGRPHVSEPTLLIDRCLGHREGVQVTRFGGAQFQDFSRLLELESDQERQDLREKYKRLPISIRLQLEIFGRHQGLPRTAEFLSTLAHVEFPDGEKLPVVNALGYGPADTGPGKYAQVWTEPHGTILDEITPYKVYRYLVRIHDRTVTPEGWIPGFPQDYTRHARVETFQVPSGHTLRDTSAWTNRRSWIPRIGTDGKPSREFVPQRVATLG